MADDRDGLEWEPYLTGLAPVRDTVAVGRGASAFGPLRIVAGSGETNATCTIDAAVAAPTEWEEGSGAAGSLWPFASSTGAGLFCLDLSTAGEPPVVFVDLADGAGLPYRTIPVATSYELLARLE